MPSSSIKQHNLMAMVAHDPAASKKLGIPQSIGREFVKADAGRKFRKGGDMKEAKATIGKEVSFMKKAGAPRSMINREESEMMGMKKMASGGITSAKMGKVTSGGRKAHGEHTVQSKGHTKGKMVTMKGSTPLGMKRGGKC